jgi:HSP20 family protein
MQRMQRHIQTIAVPSDVGDFAAEIRQVFLELGPSFGAESLVGECSPAIDVYETDESLEIVVDLPGADPSAIRILAKGDAVLIAGDKARTRPRGDSSFHLVERGYGRFARSVRLARPCDMSRAAATFKNGELRIRFPKIAERRGHAIRIDVS